MKTDDLKQPHAQEIVQSSTTGGTVSAAICPCGKKTTGYRNEDRDGLCTECMITAHAAMRAKFAAAQKLIHSLERQLREARMGHDASATEMLVEELRIDIDGFKAQGAELEERLGKVKRELATVTDENTALHHWCNGASAELTYLREHHDECHQPAANYELVLARLAGTPTNHGNCPVAATLDEYEAEIERLRLLEAAVGDNLLARRVACECSARYGSTPYHAESIMAEYRAALRAAMEEQP